MEEWALLHDIYQCKGCTLLVCFLYILVGNPEGQCVSPEWLLRDANIFLNSTSVMLSLKTVVTGRVKGFLQKDHSVPKRETRLLLQGNKVFHLLGFPEYDHVVVLQGE